MDKCFNYNWHFEGRPGGGDEPSDIMNWVTLQTGLNKMSKRESSEQNKLFM